MKFEIDLISIKGTVFSEHLNRKVKFRWVAPANYENFLKTFHILLMNDGQDFFPMKLEDTLAKTFASADIHPFIYIGLECNEDRIQEYGIASSADFKGRGGKAMKYSKFIIEEFIPFLKKEFKVSANHSEWVYCGMSLGGLSAFDIVLNHSRYFGKVGVFSGSFWWRKKAYNKKDLRDRSRIILEVIKNGSYSPPLKFWLQCGTEDETADRNQNGVIDSIDDTLDVIKELELKGYSHPGDITYLQIEGGKHDLPTWGTVFPEFLEWAFGKASPSSPHKGELSANAI